MPYHAWAISHSKHHANTNSCENDEVFAAASESDFALRESMADTPLAHLGGIVLMLTFGWCVAEGRVGSWLPERGGCREAGSVSEAAPNPG